MAEKGPGERSSGSDVERLVGEVNRLWMDAFGNDFQEQLRDSDSEVVLAAMYARAASLGYVTLTDEGVEKVRAAREFLSACASRGWRRPDGR